jgi:hypothetical protein
MNYIGSAFLLDFAKFPLRDFGLDVAYLVVEPQQVVLGLGESADWRQVRHQPRRQRRMARSL